MRNIKELLEIMLNNQQLFTTGLCDWVSHLNCYGLINYFELKSLKRYILDNRPNTFSDDETLMYSAPSFYWIEGNIKPRIKWIKKHIKKNS